jgi:hypothetical protein
VRAVAKPPIRLVPGNGNVPGAAAEGDVVKRLARWLADVSAEAACAPLAPATTPTPLLPFGNPRAGGSAR